MDSCMSSIGNCMRSPSPNNIRLYFQSDASRQCHPFSDSESSRPRSNYFSGNVQNYAQVLHLLSRSKSSLPQGYSHAETVHIEGMRWLQPYNTSPSLTEAMAMASRSCTSLQIRPTMRLRDQPQTPQDLIILASPRAPLLPSFRSNASGACWPSNRPAPGPTVPPLASREPAGAARPAGPATTLSYAGLLVAGLAPRRPPPYRRPPAEAAVVAAAAADGRPKRKLSAGAADGAERAADGGDGRRQRPCGGGGDGPGRASAMSVASLLAPA
jgi:hypothetical protein